MSKNKHLTRTIRKLDHIQLLAEQALKAEAQQDTQAMNDYRRQCIKQIEKLADLNSELSHKYYQAIGLDDDMAFIASDSFCELRELELQQESRAVYILSGIAAIIFIASYFI